MSGRASRLAFCLLLSGVLFGCASAPRGTLDESNTAVVKNYFAALNRRDLLALTAYVTPDVEWFSMVQGERIQEVAGRAALTESLQTHFSQTALSSWTIESMSQANRFIAVRERTRWRTASEEGEREALCVYEIQDGRIRRITQFLH
jgi:ketosteroid isomerase-like protein